MRERERETALLSSFPATLMCSGSRRRTSPVHSSSSWVSAGCRCPTHAASRGGACDEREAVRFGIGSNHAVLSDCHRSLPCVACTCLSSPQAMSGAFPLIFWLYLALALRLLLCGLGRGMCDAACHTKHPRDEPHMLHVTLWSFGADRAWIVHRCW